MKTVTRTLTSLALLVLLTTATSAGETDRPPLACDPLTQECPLDGGTQSVNSPTDESADATAISVPADVVVTLINLTLGLIS